MGCDRYAEGSTYDAEDHRSDTDDHDSYTIGQMTSGDNQGIGDEEDCQHMFKADM